MKTLHTIPLLAALLLSCRGPEDKPVTGDSADPGPDVSVRLGPGEVRAGTVRSGAALFGGTSAEGREGDLKIYNAEVQFIIQGVRDGDYYESLGGGVIDADIVRPEGMPGRDVVDELGVMVGIGRLVAPDVVEVVADGSDGQAAVVRVVGSGAPLTLLTGALETDSVVPEVDVQISTEYRLEPDSHHLEATTTVEWNDDATSVQVGDLVMAGMEVVDTVFPGRGLEGGEGSSTGAWSGLMGQRNEVAFAVFSDDVAFSTGAIETLLSEIGPVLAPLRPGELLDTGDTITYSRTIAVGPDLATLTGEWHARRGDATETVGGTVTAGGQPVAGARVHLLDDGALETVAVTDASGVWSAAVTSAAPTAVASGRGHGNTLDLPAGAGWVAPYAHPDVAAGVLGSLQDGAPEVLFAEGYGVSEPVAATADTALSLTAPGTLSVTVGDGLPAVVRVDFAAGDPASVDPALVPGRPSGAAAYGYIRDGDLDVPLEPGEYVVTVHRGLRYEPHQEVIFVESGESAEVSASLDEVVAPDGIFALDPHSHASPSGDGKIAMAPRLLTMAASGVQVHFGTDHDHVADYRPLLSPLGLDGVLASVVANEASPVLRGHTNVYPVSADVGQPNAGAPRWWEDMIDTPTWVADIRAWAGPDALIQLNHPAGSSGQLGAAGYDPTSGTIRKPDFFSSDFDAIEVLNDGSYDEYLPMYLDLVVRGYSTVPVGVSDSHGYRNGVGENYTWLPIDIGSVSELTDSALVAAMRAGGTVVSRGPFLDVRVDGEWAPGGTFAGATDLDVTVVAPSFVVVDELVLLENGVEVARVPATGTVGFALEPEDDALYVVIAEGSTPMQPVSSRTPWAMAAAIQLDATGDGWTPPLPPLSMGDD